VHPVSSIVQKISKSKKFSGVILGEGRGGSRPRGSLLRQVEEGSSISLLLSKRMFVSVRISTAFSPSRQSVMSETRNCSLLAKNFLSSAGLFEKLRFLS
jgi:hypothetical protein